MDFDTAQYLGVAEAAARGVAAPVLMGSLFALLLYGTLLSQFNTYFRYHWDNDSVVTKTLVSLLLFLCSGQVALSILISHHYTISVFGDVERLNVIYPADAVMVVVGGFIAAIVQSFLAFRVSRLRKSFLIPAIVWVMAAAEVGLLTYCTVRIRQLGNWRGLNSVRPPIIVWSCLSPFIDVLVSASLVTFLRKNKTGFATTDDIISRINRLTLQTGSITVVWTAVLLILYLAYPTNLNAFVLLYPLGMVYALCMMSSLNSRSAWDSSRTPSSNPNRESRGIHVLKSTVAHHDVELGGYPSVAGGGGGAAAGGPGSNSKHHSTTPVQMLRGGRTPSYMSAVSSPSPPSSATMIEFGFSASSAANSKRDSIEYGRDLSKAPSLAGVLEEDWRSSKSGKTSGSE